ncbi:transposase, partial [Limnospira platensis]|uniref:transposase n=1 Tax=Limnospira platensis TaxID=118562 RepID=UPI001689B735
MTICTKRMRPVFGTVVNGHMHLNDAGNVADAFWREIPEHFPNVTVDEHVVMPDHVHGLLHIPTASNGHNPTARRGERRGGMEAFGKPVPGSIPTVIRSYKSAVSRALGQKFWHPRFYEVRARDERAIANIRRYIRENP